MSKFKLHQKPIVSDISADIPQNSLFRQTGFCMRESSILSSVTRDECPKVDPNHPDKWYQTVETKHEGRISSKELQQAFETFQGRRFSDSACKFVVRIFDLDRNGGIDIKEFETLYFYMKAWVKAFNNFDKEGTGMLNESELDLALRQLDIHFSPEFIKFLIARNNPNTKKISLDQYIITCIQIQKFTDEFKKRDPNYTGNVNIKYEEFLEMILKCF